MSAERDDDLDPALERALDALVDERPDPRFAREQRERFIAAPTPRRPRTAVWAALASAAGLALALAWWRAGDALQPSWSVLATEGQVTLDGRQLEAADLSAGGRLRTGPDSGLRLRYARTLALVLGPESDVELPAAASARDAWLLRAHAGHLAVGTGPDFAGMRLEVLAPDAEIAVVGTRFAIDVFGEGTCVCCGAGRVDVRSLRDGAAAAVEPGGMAFAHAAGTVSTGLVQSEHAPALAALEEAFE